MKKRGLAVLITTTMLLSACGNAGGVKTKEALIEGYGKAVLETEAENGTVTGKANIKTGNSSYSNEGYVTGFEGEQDTASVLIKINEAGFYDLVFTIKSNGGYKENHVFVDLVQQGSIECESGSLEEAVLKRVYLDGGDHEITIKKNWGWIDWDKLTVYESAPLPDSIYEVSPKLCNENASDNAKRVMTYLTDIYGDYILSGQYGEGGIGSWETFKVKEVNGQKAPAVYGLELGHLCQTALDNNFSHSSIKDAIKVWENGGIVTMCYHWLAPQKYITGIWWNGFRTAAVDIPLEKIMNGEDEEGMNLILNDIKILAEALQELEDAGVPVLFRPLHEAAGGWFWWGDHGADTYKKLYVLMYEQLTDVYGLDNLIWIWNGQDGDWYPGDEYVDIIGIDIYQDEHEYASNINSFLKLYSWLPSANKMIVLSENGTMPDIDACVRDGAMWGFFCTWEKDYVVTGDTVVKYSEQYTEKEMVKTIYNHERVITLDELPDLKTYEFRNK